MTKVYRTIDYYSDPQQQSLFDGTLEQCEEYIITHHNTHATMIVMDANDPENNQFVAEADNGAFNIYKQWNNKIGGWNYYHEQYGLIVDSLVANVDYLTSVIDDIKKEW